MPYKKFNHLSIYPFIQTNHFKRLCSGYFDYIWHCAFAILSLCQQRAEKQPKVSLFHCSEPLS
jgi:hypothetical protein